MPTINLDDSPFAGRTSTPPTNRAEPSDCRHCGSQLGGRYVGIRFMGRRAVRVWACPCGHERWLEVEAAAA
jgi:hypothetical protein